MQSYLPGTVQEIEEVPVGSCILFAFHQKARVGFVVEMPGDARGILDLDAETTDGQKYPAIYQIEHFGRERVFVYEEARVVPAVEPATIGFGYHNNGGATKALYLSGDELVVQASNKQRVARIDLVTGSLTQADVAFAMHCTRWRVEAPNADGDYRTLVEFTA